MRDHPVAWVTVFLILALIAGVLLGMEIGQWRGERNERKFWHGRMLALYRTIVVHQQTEADADIAEPVKGVIKAWLVIDPDALNETQIADNWEPQ